MNFDNRMITCDLCHGAFQVTPNTLKEEMVTLRKNGEDHVVSLTFLLCPKCGKIYPVILDDAETLPILHELRDCLKRRMKYAYNARGIPQKLQRKHDRLNKQLDFKRRKLAEKFNGALYKFEGDTMQLDYRYRAQ